MNENPPKKSPVTVTSEPHELEHEIRLRAQELYEEGVGRTATSWTTGSARKRKSSRRRHALSPPDYAHIQIDPGPGPRGLFHVNPRPCHHFNRQLKCSGVLSRPASNLYDS